MITDRIIDNEISPIEVVVVFPQTFFYWIDLIFFVLLLIAVTEKEIRQW